MTLFSWPVLAALVAGCVGLAYVGKAASPPETLDAQVARHEAEETQRLAAEAQSRRGDLEINAYRAVRAMLVDANDDITRPGFWGMRKRRKEVLLELKRIATDIYNLKGIRTKNGS